MACEICGRTDSRVEVILPIKQPDGRLETMACLGCAEESSAYCLKHERPHIGFADDKTTACVLCIEETVASKTTEADKIFKALRDNLPQEEATKLELWAKESSFITEDSLAISVLRFLATKALRLKTTVEKIEKQILRAKSVELILPKDSFDLTMGLPEDPILSN